MRKAQSDCIESATEEMRVMQSTLRFHTPMTSRTAVLIGVAAATGVVGAAAMMSAVTAPSAHADDLTDIINAVDGDFAYGQSDFATALSDFSTPGDFIYGLAASTSGLDEYLVAAPENLLVGSVEALGNAPIDYSYSDVIGVASSFGAAVAGAETGFGEAEAELDNAALALFSADFVTAVQDSVFASTSVDNSVEYLLIGTLAALGL
jgi:hypothetical protein